MVNLGDLGLGDDLCPECDIMQVGGSFPEISFQYNQLCNLITKIQKKSNPFCLLTEFEVLGPIKAVYRKEYPF